MIKDDKLYDGLRKVILLHERHQELKAKLFELHRQIEDAGKEVYCSYDIDNVPEESVIRVGTKWYRVLFDVDECRLSRVEEIECVQPES
jgi:hypothetical protein